MIDLPDDYVDGVRVLLRDQADGWLAELPGQIKRFVDEWQLTPATGVMHGMCAIVLPVTTTDGAEAVLKVGITGPDNLPEAEALRLWDGRGAVRLLRTDPLVDGKRGVDHNGDWFGTNALLLERLDNSRMLEDVEHETGAAIIGRLLRRLAVRVEDSVVLVRQNDTAARWTTELPERWDRLGRPFDRRLLDLAVDTCQQLTVTEPVVVHGDLHQMNVLASSREPWLAIDPKGVAGEPEFDVEPALRNCWDALVETGDLRRALLRRLAIIVEAGELDGERARLWSQARAVDNVLWAYNDQDPEFFSNALEIATTLS
ncbi:aminoglycoside phosphotransferase family protein [Fodinicola acaciae]|uniref:aminoglycoside phosphotransferase family protein n=1 Tax=Fodinicola acaciae TaxID=2681555 RepID=UPI0013D09A9A|nr:aminoglycoside phosphotransferase family protein [Fodinicola acaciae]